MSSWRPTSQHLVDGPGQAKGQGRGPGQGKQCCQDPEDEKAVPSVRRLQVSAGGPPEAGAAVPSSPGVKNQAGLSRTGARERAGRGQHGQVSSWSLGIAEANTFLRGYAGEAHRLGKEEASSGKQGTTLYLVPHEYECSEVTL